MALVSMAWVGGQDSASDQGRLRSLLPICRPWQVGQVRTAPCQPRLAAFPRLDSEGLCEGHHGGGGYRLGLSTSGRVLVKDS